MGSYFWVDEHHSTSVCKWFFVSSQQGIAGFWPLQVAKSLANPQHNHHFPYYAGHILGLIWLTIFRHPHLSMKHLWLNHVKSPFFWRWTSPILRPNTVSSWYAYITNPQYIPIEILWNHHVPYAFPMFCSQVSSCASSVSAGRPLWASAAVARSAKPSRATASNGRRPWGAITWHPVYTSDIYIYMVIYR